MPCKIQHQHARERGERESAVPQVSDLQENLRDNESRRYCYSFRVHDISGIQRGQCTTFLGPVMSETIVLSSTSSTEFDNKFSDLYFTDMA
jgi:hypothetical protein